MAPVIHASAWWGVERLIAASIQGAIAIALVWFVCRYVRALPASARALLWWLASLRLIVALLPLPSFTVPLLPPAPVLAPGASIARPAAVTEAPALSLPVMPSSSSVRTVQYAVIGALALWVAAMTIQAFRLGATYARLRQIRRRSVPVTTEDAIVVGRLAGLVGLKTMPVVRVSEEIDTPFVVGSFQPTVLLPATMARLSDDEREMAICHELAHVRRRDLLLGWVPAVAERLFFFHPLARVAAREYVTEREAACDAVALRAIGAGPHEYGQMLLRLGVGRVDTAFTAGGSSSSMSSLKRRIAMLHDLSSRRLGRGAIGLLAMVAALALTPFHVTARTRPQPRAAAATAPRLAALDQIAPAQPQSPKAATQRKSATPAGPPPKAAPSDEQRERQSVEDQRAAMREIEKALQTMRAEFEAALSREQGLRASQADVAAEFEQLLKLAQQQRLAQDQTAEKVRTREFLENRLQALVAEQEATNMRFRQLSEEIAAIRKQLESKR
jgi:bla regulator protein blaR1